MRVEAAPEPRSARLAMLFADIAGSTGLYESLGDATARRLVTLCLDRLRTATLGQGGRVMRVIGDEIMASFSSAAAGLQAAVDMQVAISAARVAERRPLAVRIGVHHGAVLLDAADVYGDAVNLAARLVATAKAEQILTSGATVAAAGEAWRRGCRLVQVASVRGRSETVEIPEAVWRTGDLTESHGAIRLDSAIAASGRVRLEVGGSRLELHAGRPSLTIGRAEENDLVLRMPLVSRLHARLEFRGGRCVLTDQSTNGSHVVGDDGALQFVRYDSHLLGDSGLIGCGEPPAPGSPTTLAFQVWRAETPRPMPRVTAQPGG
jgi:adenylate cyclase